MAKTKLTRRHFLQVSGGALGLAALAACVPATAPSAPASQSAGTAGTPSAQPMVSQDNPLWVLQTKDFHPDYNDYIRSEIESFAKEKGWALEVAYTDAFLGNSPAIQKIAAQVQSGDAPDVWMHTVSVAQMKQLDTVVPVTDLVKQNVDTYGAIAPLMDRNAKVDADYYGVPFHVRSDGGWARKDIFDAKGIDLSTLSTFDELRDACLAVSQPDNQLWGWGITVNRGGDGAWMIARALTGFGANWQDETGQYVTVNSPEAVKAVEWLVDTYTNDKWANMLPPGVLSWTDTSNNEAYLGGKVAYTQNAGTVYAKAVVDKNPIADNTIYDPPKGGPVLKSFNGEGGTNFLMIKGGKNADAAREMILHFFQEDILKKVYTVATSYALPAYESMWDWKEITDVAASIAQKKTALDPTGWSAYAWPGPSNAQISAMQNANIPTDMVAAVLNGKSTAAEAVKDAESRSIEIYKEFGAPGTKA